MLRIATSSSLTGTILCQAFISVFSGAVFLFSKIMHLLKLPHILHKLGNPDQTDGLTNSFMSKGVDCRAGVFWQWFSGVLCAWGCARILEWAQHSGVEGCSCGDVLGVDSWCAAQLHCQQGNFPFSFVATLWNISSEVPDLYKRGWRTARLFLKVLCGEERDKRVSSVLCRDERRVFEWNCAFHHHQLILARWGCPSSKCCCTWGSAAAGCLGEQWLPGLLLARNGQ